MSETEQPNQPKESKAPAVEAQEAAFTPPPTPAADQAGAPAGQPAKEAATSHPEQAKKTSSDAASADDQLAAARREASAAQDRYLRAIADLENFRRRSVREKDELRAFAAARVVEELLPVIDNLALGLAAAKAPNADLTNLVGGIEMVANQLKGALANHGLKEVNPTGQPFDPNQHEAISQQPSADVPEGQVLQVVRIGYTLNGRLLRPASVIVSSGPASPANA